MPARWSRWRATPACPVCRTRAPGSPSSRSTQGLRVEVVPGPFAAAVALVGSGLLDPSGRFCFEGFLPRKGATRAARLAELVGERRTIVLYEAPHRLARTLSDLGQRLGGDRRVALCRELTKLHEESWRGTLDDAVARCDEVEPRGEYVVVVEGAGGGGRRAARHGDRVEPPPVSVWRRGAPSPNASGPPNRVKRLLTGGDPAAQRRGRSRDDEVRRLAPEPGHAAADPRIVLTNTSPASPAASWCGIMMTPTTGNTVWRTRSSSPSAWPSLPAGHVPGSTRRAWRCAAAAP